MGKYFYRKNQIEQTIISIESNLITNNKMNEIRSLEIFYFFFSPFREHYIIVFPLPFWIYRMWIQKHDSTWMEPAINKIEFILSSNCCYEFCGFISVGSFNSTKHRNIHASVNNITSQKVNLCFVIFDIFPFFCFLSLDFFTFQSRFFLGMRVLTVHTKRKNSRKVSGSERFSCTCFLSLH